MVVIDLVNSIAIAGLGALLTFALGYGYRRHRDRRLRMRYPVSGRFATIYDDRDGDVTLSARAHTVLRQKGREVSGETIDLSTTRRWILKGEVRPGGIVHGFYSSEDPHDAGLGTFVFTVDGRGGDLDGLWAGYDSVNKEVSGGRYILRRCPDVKISAIQSTDITTVVALLGEALGERYIEPDDVSQIMADPTRGACLVARTPDGDILGAAITSMLGLADLPARLPVGQDDLPRRLGALRYHSSIGLLDALATVPTVRGRGLGTELVNECVRHWRAHGATAALSFGWKSPAGCHIKGVLESCGFRAQFEVEDFWLEDSRLHHYSCPSCGSTCRCSAVVFIRSGL